MTFRRFGIAGFVNSDNTVELFGGEYEVLINLRSIQSIGALWNSEFTLIRLTNGESWLSTIEYKHLADALDGRGD